MNLSWLKGTRNSSFAHCEGLGDSSLGDGQGLDSVPWMIVGIRETYVNDILGGQGNLYEKDYGDSGNSFLVDCRSQKLYHR